MPVVAPTLIHFPALWQTRVLICNFSILCYRCPFLHRTAGDTERRYHLRYYKTGSCIHETDAKGHCSKNGSHCAFAHGSHDLRSPVYDIRCNITHWNTAKLWYCICGFDSYSLFCSLQRSASNGVSGRCGGHRGRWTVRTGSKYRPHREDSERRTTLAR